MFVKNGSRLVARSVKVESVAARGFFSSLYRWSRAGAGVEPGCERLSLGYMRSFHSQSRSAQTSFPPQSPHDPQLEDTPSYEPPPTLSNSVRQVMRHVPAPIVILTTSHRTPDVSQQAQYRGMTLSTFTTVTLTPEPIISFNIRSQPDSPSRTLEAIEERGEFLIHLLSGRKVAGKIADHFTRGNTEDNSLFGEDQEGKDYSFQVQDVGGLPMLLRKRTVNAVLRCEVLGDGQGFVRVGDHVLVLARVGEVLNARTAQINFSGLCYENGTYRNPRMFPTSNAKDDHGSDE